MKKLIFILLILLLIPFSIVRADNIQVNKSVYIPKDKAIPETLFITANTVTIDGSVAGDVIIIAKNININGHIDGDLIALTSNNININGSVGGNVRAITQSVNINSFVSRNINLIASNVVLDSNSNINWDAYIIADEVLVKGKIHRNLTGKIKQLIITGEIDNVKVTTEKSFVIENAKINGQIIYHSNQNLQLSSKTKIKTTPTRIPLPQKNTYWTWSLLFKILSALLIGFVIIIIGKKKLLLLTKQTKNIKKSIIPGIIVTLITPPIVILLALTIIGIPLAFILLTLWLIAIYLAKILSAIFLSSLTLQHFKISNSLIPALIIGVIIFWLLFALPYIGSLISTLSILFGMSLIYLYVKNKS